MSDAEPFEIRDPVHGFIRLSHLEWDLINQPSFQRLHRIRQLAWTDMVYPGAMHTRSEHSLGVMHVASRLFDGLIRQSSDILKSDYMLREDGLGRQRRIIRLAGLLHDVGHGPFSHAAEELFPVNPDTGRRYEHEDYSAAIIRTDLVDVIRNHPESRGTGIEADDVLGVFATPAADSGALVWKDLVSGQMDADRMDYLLRDAHHAGVQYGRFDLDRIAHTVRLCADANDYGHHIGVHEDGIHAVEGLLIARFMMFTQLYFHKTRAILDFHLEECLKHLLAREGGTFPVPAAVAEYLRWDDWRVLGAIAAGDGGVHGEILRNRKHYRKVFGTSETMSAKEFDLVEKLEQMLKGLGGVVRDASKSWYKAGADEIRVWRVSGGAPHTVPLASLSPVVKGLKEVNQRRLYVPPENRDKAAAVVAKLTGGRNGQ